MAPGRRRCPFRCCSPLADHITSVTGDDPVADRRCVWRRGALAVVGALILCRRRESGVMALLTVGGPPAAAGRCHRESDPVALLAAAVGRHAGVVTTGAFSRRGRSGRADLVGAVRGIGADRRHRRLQRPGRRRRCCSRWRLVVTVAGRHPASWLGRNRFRGLSGCTDADARRPPVSTCSLDSAATPWAVSMLAASLLMIACGVAILVCGAGRRRGSRVVVVGDRVVVSSLRVTTFTVTAGVLVAGRTAGSGRAHGGDHLLDRHGGGLVRRCAAHGAATTERRRSPEVWP